MEHVPWLLSASRPTPRSEDGWRCLTPRMSAMFPPQTRLPPLSLLPARNRANLCHRAPRPPRGGQRSRPLGGARARGLAKRRRGGPATPLLRRCRRHLPFFDPKRRSHRSLASVSTGAEV
ncbi:hypothetical protein AAFF_G00044790 [Aldrovandia affinis]|uniref:Uncharacterized protein n=1 Tax=Aldrovandia affinis TaxID=143900 RepID=A0AAD7WF06_9TELE|nr:hypothetical protein AAFF_G00044790 [Aldrovandia affinis]